MSLIDTTTLEQRLTDLDTTARETASAVIAAAETASAAEVQAGEAKTAAASATTLAQTALDAVANLPAPQPPTPPSPVASVRTPFDSLGADDAARFAELVRRYKTGWRGEVEFAVRAHSCPVQIPTSAGIRWSGTATPAREFGTGTVITYTGPAGSSMFTLYANSGYSYPSGGVSRDVAFTGIQFNSGNDRDFLPPADFTKGFNSAYVQWYWTFHNCGWSGWKRIANGWGDGFVMSGTTHWQAGVDTFSMGGSENHFFGDGSLVDSSQPAWISGGKPFLDMSGDKWVMGAAMLSARGTSYQLKVSGGGAGLCQGTYFDAPDSAPTQGAQVRVTGGAGLSLMGCSFKGGGGIAGLSGSSQIAVTGSRFTANRGLARLEAAFTGVLLWGLNTYEKGTPPVIYAARLSQVICLDPRVTVKSLDGTQTLRAATA